MTSSNILQRLERTRRRSGSLWTATAVLGRLGVPAFRLWPELTVPCETLEQQLTNLFRAWGMNAANTATTVRHVLYADLHGIDSHGCAMLHKYRTALEAGTLQPAAVARVVTEGSTTAVVDGGGGLGHVPGDMAMQLAIDKCAEHGIGAVAVRNSGHFGAAGAYAALAADRGMIGLATTNAPPALVPTHGRTPMLGTNPLAFAAPAHDEQPFMLDMATSIVPLGKIVTAWRAGRSIPAGWALNRHARPLRNTRRAFELRRLVPLGATPEMGSHKGYGLAAMVEILSAVLCGSRGTGAVGHFMLALDPARFRPDGEFDADLAAMMGDLRAAERIDPEHPVRVPGDPEYAIATERRRSGIPLLRSVVEDIRAVCEASRVNFVLDRTDGTQP